MTDVTATAERARRFAALHVPGRPIVLPNAWDAASAYVIAAAGAQAIATSSGACAWSIGRGDGDHMTRAEALSAIARIVAAVDLPVTADIERGYGDGVELAATIAEVIEIGAVGVNLEDSGGDPLWPVAVAAERIAIAREAADRAGVPLYINARTDVFFTPGLPGDGRFDDAVARARAYLAAGASGIFVPGVGDVGLIHRLTRAIAAPVNILGGPTAPPVPELAAAGVARVSVGASLSAAVLATLREIAGELLRIGSTRHLGGIDRQEINQYFVNR